MADTGSSTDLDSEREFLAKQIASARKFLDDTMAATGEMLDLLDNEAALMKKKLELERTTKSQSAYMELLDAAGNLMYSEMKLMEEVDELKARVDQLTRRNRSLHNKNMNMRDKLRSRKDKLANTKSE